MDKKTETLRDIFVDVTGSETVTEHQSDPRGSIPTDSEKIDVRIRAVIERMTDRYELETPLSDEELVVVVRSFFEGKDDKTIAAKLDETHDPATVTDARIQLHLLTEEDLDGPIDGAQLQTRLDDGESIEEIAADLDIEKSILQQYRRVLEVQRERRLVGDRFRQSFEYAMGEASLSHRLTENIKKDGLEDATEDIETNVSF